MTARTSAAPRRFELAPRWFLRGGIVLAGALSSGACVIPEYYIDGGGSGGSSGGDSTDSGGTQGSGGGTQSGTGGGSTDGGTGGTSDGGTGGTGGTKNGDGGAPSGGGTGGISPDWSCADEEPNPPEYFSNGVMCGYVYAFETPQDSIDYDWVCEAGAGAACKTAEDRYLVATIPAASPPEYPTVGLGFRLAQHPSGAVRGRYELSGYGLSLDYVADGAARTANVQLVADGDVYCAQATRDTVLAWEDFRFECWNAADGERLSAGDQVDELQVTVGAVDAEQVLTNFSLGELTLYDEEPPFACDGCAKLFVPLEDAGVDDGTLYMLEFVNFFDMSDDDVRLVARVYVDTHSTAGSLQLVLRSDAPGQPVVYAWHELWRTKGWYDIVVAPAELAGIDGFDPSEVDAIGIQVTGGGATAGTVLTDTTVYVDSFTFTGAIAGSLPNVTFNSSLEGLTMMSDGVPGSTIEWLDSP